jgi:MFS family permease
MTEPHLGRPLSGSPETHTPPLGRGTCGGPAVAIHGNFEGAAQKKVYALVGAAAAIAAAVGPLLGGFLTTYLSWRVGFALEVVIIAGVLSGIRLVHDVPYTGPRNIDVVGALLSVLVMGGIVLSILVRQEGGESVGILMAVGAIAMVGLVGGRVLRAHPHLLTPHRSPEADPGPGATPPPSTHRMKPAGSGL